MAGVRARQDGGRACGAGEQDDNIGAAAHDGGVGEIRRVEPFASTPALLASRAHALATPARKTRLFALHDALVAEHDDVAALFAPAADRDFSYGMPDCVFATPPAKRSRNQHKNFAEHGARKFVRALLPVRVADDGSELRIGVWVEIAGADFARLVSVFWDDEPAYMATVIAGTIETSCPLRGDDLRGAPVTLAARTADQCLFVRTSDDVRVTHLIRDGVFARQVPGMMRRLTRSSRLAGSA